MYKVRKRTGKIVGFDITRIKDAISSAFDAVERNTDENIIDFLALKVTSEFDPKVVNNIIDVESIQDSVEEVLSKSGYTDVAKAYILYRKLHEKMRNMKSTILDYKDVVNSYINVTDWRVKENSTVTYSVGGLILSNSGAITANYWLDEIYDEQNQQITNIVPENLEYKVINEHWRGFAHPEVFDRYTTKPVKQAEYNHNFNTNDGDRLVFGKVGEMSWEFWGIYELDKIDKKTKTKVWKLASPEYSGVGSIKSSIEK